MCLCTQLIAGVSVSAVLAVVVIDSVSLRIKTQAECLSAFHRAPTVQAHANLLTLMQEFTFYGESRAARQWRKRHAHIKRNASEEIALLQFSSRDIASIIANQMSKRNRLRLVFYGANVALNFLLADPA